MFERRMTKRERMALGDKSGTFRALVLFGTYPAAVPFTLDTVASVRSWGKTEKELWGSTLPPLKFEKKKNKEKLLELKLGKKGRKYWKIFSWFCFYLKQNKIFDRWMAKKKRKMTGTELWYDNNHHHITMRIMAQRPKADRSKDFLLYYHPIRCSILYTTVYFSFWILIAIYLYCSPLLCVAFISRLLLVSTY